MPAAFPTVKRATIAISIVALTLSTSPVRAPAAPTVPVLPSTQLAVPNGIWEELNSPHDWEHCAVYDSHRDRMILFQSYYQNTETWALEFTPSPTLTHLDPVGPRPPFRSNATAIYDPVRDRMVVYGGDSGDVPPWHGDIWALELSSYPAWHELVAADTVPVARSNHGAIYDPVGDRMIVFGGYDGHADLNDLWASSLTHPVRWTLLNATGTKPAARSGHTAIYDADHQRMIVYGGASGCNGLTDVWSLSLTGTPAWTRLLPGGTTPTGGRYDHVAVFDSQHHRMVVQGGNGNCQASQPDAWALSLDPGSETWSSIAATGSDLENRSSHVGIYDAIRDRLVVHGGSPTLNDFDALSLGAGFAWTQLWPAVDYGPNLDLGPTQVAYDSARHQLLVYHYTTLWAMTLDGHPQWTQLATTGTVPTLQYGQAVIYDPMRDRLLFFGGAEMNNGITNHLYTLTLAPPRTWGTLAPSGTPPTGRTDAKAIYDPLGDRMLIFGGWSPVDGDHNDLYSIALGGPASWTPLATNGTPPSPRQRFLMVYDPARRRMVIHGGGTASNLWSDVQVLSLDGGTPTWSQIAVAGVPLEAMNQAGVYDPVRDRLVVILNNAEVDALPFSGTPEWVTLAPTGWVTSFYGAGIYDPNYDRAVVLSANGNPFSLRFDVPELTAAPVAPTDIGAVPRIALLRPNPAQRRFDVEFTLPGDSPASVQVFDLAGRVVWTSPAVFATGGPHHAAVALGGAARAGLYFVRVMQGGHAAVKRVAVAD